MAAQIPPAADGYVAGVLVYSVICLGLSLLLLWLVWTHQERTSFVAFLAGFTSLSTSTSIVQQIHTIVSWRDVKRDEYTYRLAAGDSPELYIAGASTGLDLVLFYLQFYCYNVEALLVVLWAAELAWAVFRLRAFRSKRIGEQALLVAKGLAVMFPVLQVSLLRTSPVQRDKAGFLFLANVIMVFSFLSSSVLLLVIAARYVSSRRSLTTWDVPYGQCSQGTQMTDATTKLGNKGLLGNKASRRLGRNIYDTWLLVRFSIAFVMLGVFQLLSILFEVRAQRTAHAASPNNGLDLSPAKARTDFNHFLPGVTASLVVFIIFGTTRTFLDGMWRAFVPKRVRERYETWRWARRIPSVVVVRREQPATIARIPSPRRPSIAKVNRHDSYRYTAGENFGHGGLDGNYPGCPWTGPFTAELDGSPRRLSSTGPDGRSLRAMGRQGAVGYEMEQYTGKQDGKRGSRGA